MIKFPNIVPIFHKLNSGEEFFDGTGFIFNTFSGLSVFATCWHNFKEAELSKSYIIYNGKEIEIKRNSDKYFEGNGDFIPTTYFKTGIVDDYAFYLLEIAIDSPLEFEEEDYSNAELILITHDNNGKQVVLDCQKYLEPKLNYNMKGLGYSVDPTNLINLICNEAKKGNSGGPIINLKSNKCIGILHGENAPNNIKWVIKSNSILERFKNLRVE
jgi:hypothetical protein